MSATSSLRSLAQLLRRAPRINREPPAPQDALGGEFDERHLARHAPQSRHENEGSPKCLAGLTGDRAETSHGRKYAPTGGDDAVPKTHREGGGVRLFHLKIWETFNPAYPKTEVDYFIPCPLAKGETVMCFRRRPASPLMAISRHSPA